MGVGQRTFRYYDDDGGLEAATALGAEGENITIATGVKFRIRQQMLATAGGYNNDFELHAIYDGGTRFKITSSSSYIQLVDDDNSIADDSATAQALSGAETFVAGRYDDTDNAMTAIVVAEDEITECEWCLQLVEEDVEDAKQIQLLVRDGGGFAISNADAAWLTVQGGAPPTTNRRRRLLITA